MAPKSPSSSNKTKQAQILSGLQQRHPQGSQQGTTSPQSPAASALDVLDIVVADDNDNLYASIEAANLALSTADELSEERRRQAAALVDPPTIGQMVAGASQSIPLNEFGFPCGFFDTSRLPDEYRAPGSRVPFATWPLDERIRAFRGAFVPLAYDEGFPAQPTGAPFWYRLPAETPEEFELFERYLGFAEQGSRGLFMLCPPNGEEPTIEQIQELFRLHDWRVRTKAFDLFEQARNLRAKELRAQALEREHTKKADQVFTRLWNILEGTDAPEFWELIAKQPKNVVELLKTVMQWSRMSAGLSATGPAPIHSILEAAGLRELPSQFNGFEALFQHLAKTSAGQAVEAGMVDQVERLISQARDPGDQRSLDYNPAEFHRTSQRGSSPPSGADAGSGDGNEPQRFGKVKGSEELSGLNSAIAVAERRLREQRERDARRAEGTL